jgi:thiosulfate dehydrogenase
MAMSQFQRITTLLGGLAAVLFAIAASGQTAPPRPRTPVVTWNIPDMDMLPDNEDGRLARYGRSLLTATYAHKGTLLRAMQATTSPAQIVIWMAD